MRTKLRECDIGTFPQHFKGGNISVPSYQKKTNSHPTHACLHETMSSFPIKFRAEGCLKSATTWIRQPGHTALCGLGMNNYFELIFLKKETAFIILF